MNASLTEVASIRPGIQFREAIRHSETGTLGVIQAGDISADGLDLARVARLHVGPEAASDQAVKASSVVMQCRGMSYRAAVVPATEMKMIASASVLIIDARPEILPAYLALFLNDPATQAELRKLATGATIKNLKRSALETLEVQLPTLKDQAAIVALGDTLHHQSRLEARLAELRRTELRALLEKCAGRNRKRESAPGS